MEAIKFYNLAEGNSYRLFELCKAEDWTTAKDFDEWIETGGDLAFFEGDPDMLKVDGSTGYFWRQDNEVFVYIDTLDFDDVEKLLTRFYDNELKTADPQTWEEWNQMENGIAFRGGAGYIYNIYAA